MAEKALIIGCGRIAGGFNESGENAVLTHAAAYGRLGVPVCGCCDLDAGRAARFARRWHIDRAGADLRQILSDTQPQLVSICTPPAARLSLIQTVLAAPSVRSLLVEKPVALTGAEARQIQELASEDGRPILVNFFRAFDPFYGKLIAEINAGHFGPWCEGTARYYGSAWANASHWLERALALFGQPAATRRLSGEGDAPVFEIVFHDGRMVFLPTSGCQYSPFEMDLLFEKQRLRIIDPERRVEHGVAQPDPQFAGYFRLVVDAGWSDATPSHESLLLAVKAALEAARGNAGEWMNLLTRAVAVTEILEQIEKAP